MYIITNRKYYSSNNADDRHSFTTNTNKEQNTKTFPRLIYTLNNQLQHTHTCTCTFITLNIHTLIIQSKNQT